MKKPKVFLKIFFSFLLFCSTLTPQIQGETVGKGSARIFNKNEGAARSQALSNALRDAVKQSVGIILDSNTMVKNWVLIRDEVVSSSQGFVEKYEIIRDEQKNGTWFITLNAVVSKSGIMDKLTELRILHQKMGNKKLMVLYHPKHPRALERSHIAVDATRVSIQNKFNSSGFRVFDQAVVQQLYATLKPQGSELGINKDWIRVAKENQVDIVVEYDLFSSQQKPFTNAAFIAAKINTSIKVYDVTTGRLISSGQTMQKQMTNAEVGSYDWEDALQKAGIKAGNVIADETISKIVDYYKSVGDIGNSFFMVFKDFSEDDADKILKVLENIEGYQSLSERTYEPLLLEIEYFSTLNKGRLRRKLRADTRKEGIKLKSRQITGNRFVFINPTPASSD